MSKLLQINEANFEWENFNNDFLIIKSDNVKSLQGFGKAIFQNKLDFVEEVIVTEVEICLKLNSKFEASKIDFLKNIPQQDFQKQYIYKLPILFSDHEDWKEIESVSGFSKREVISKLLELEFNVAMFGFLPGFVYLTGLEKSLHIPRKTIPSKYVKANSLAIGGKYLGIYSIDSPGGWHVIGHLPISILEIPQLPPVIFNISDTIKLQEVQKEEFDELLKNLISLKDYNA